MLQILQHQKSGEISISEVPAPVCPEGGILVLVHYSLISAGTERQSVTNAQSSLLARIKKQPEDFKTVMTFLKKEGLMPTLKRVKAKLDSYKQLGYSISGIVTESRCDEFAPGDRVACAGAGYANHAEYVAIPKNLAIKLPENVALQDAAYTTLGAIAMQGFRQANPRLGETVAVIGLGLLGLLAVQMLSAAGTRVVGLDVDETTFELAKKFGCSLTLKSSFSSVKDIMAFSRGIGCDSVIIAAATASNSPVELAMEITRKRGRVVVLGAVGMNIPRNPFYKKEIEFTISSSYGPGRYDPQYEEMGIDYPAAYVRFTENRNMVSFVDLIAAGKMDVKSITTHKLVFTEAKKAYDIITGKITERYIGILLEYPDKDNINDSRSGKTISFNPTSGSSSKLKVAFVGAGSFAQNHLLPALVAAGAEPIAVANSTPLNAKNVADRFGFKLSSTDGKEIINSTETNVVFCATRHDTHAGFVLEALKAGKPVFVEKPLAVNFEEFSKIDRQYQKSNVGIMVGFNRRFSTSFRKIKHFFDGIQEPLTIIYRVNAGFIPTNSWIQDLAQGGRIIGEGCHFIDTMTYLTGSLPDKIYAEAVSGGNPESANRDRTLITIKFRNGSIGSLAYFANGDSSFGKEYCEVFGAGKSAVMNNFQSVELYKSGKSTKLKMDGDKGIATEIRETAESIKLGKPMPISFEEIKYVTLATFYAGLSFDTGLPQIIK